MECRLILPSQEPTNAARASGFVGQVCEISVRGTRPRIQLLYLVAEIKRICQPQQYRVIFDGGASTRIILVCILVPDVDKDTCLINVTPQVIFYMLLQNRRSAED